MMKVIGGCLSVAMVEGVRMESIVKPHAGIGSGLMAVGHQRSTVDDAKVVIFEGVPSEEEAAEFKGKILAIATDSALTEELLASVSDLIEEENIYTAESAATSVQEKKEMFERTLTLIRDTSKEYLSDITDTPENKAFLIYKPQECIVVARSDASAQAAHSAGFSVVVHTSTELDPKRTWHLEDDVYSSWGKRITEIKRPGQEKKAYLFDLDDTLIYTRHVYEKALIDTGKLPQFDIAITDEHFRMFPGTVKNFITNVYLMEKGENASQEYIDEFVAENKKLARDKILKELGIRPIRAVLDLAQQLKNDGETIALVTSGFKLDIEDNETLLREHLALMDEKYGTNYIELFPNIYINRDLDIPAKPNPTIYGYVAGRLNVKVTDCVVFEDAELGLQAAVNANMEVYDVSYIRDYPLDRSLKLKKIKDERHRQPASFTI